MKTVIKTILITTLVAGVLDGIAAVIFLGKMNFTGVWKFVASGVFGNKAFSGGNEMVIYGLLFHFSIALIWTIIYYILFRNNTFFINNIIIGGLLYGIMIWSIMNLIVLPFSNTPPINWTFFSVIPSVFVQILGIGIPIVVIHKKIKVNYTTS